MSLLGYTNRLHHIMLYDITETYVLPALTSSPVGPFLHTHSFMSYPGLTWVNGIVDSDNDSYPGIS